MKRFLLMLALICGVVSNFGLNSAFAAPAEKSNILIAYFSRAGEEYAIGPVKKGNTAIAADIIAELTGGELFQIRPEKEYPKNYKECTEVASKEKATKARPKLLVDVADFDRYEIIFVGYPIWWGDMPMPVYTFLENHKFAGKKIIPFCTHGGSGLSSTDQNITLACPGAKVLPGFEMIGKTVRNNPELAKTKISDWLKKINYAN